MGLGIEDVRYLDRRGRFRVALDLLGGALLVALGAAAGLLVDHLWREANTFPYTVVGRRMLGENGHSGHVLPEIRRGGPLIMQRFIDYDPDNVSCKRWYTRRAVSETANADGSFETQRFEAWYDPVLPYDQSGKWQNWSATLSPRFPCGDAYLAETVAASCNWINEAFGAMVKPVITTRFRVVGC